MMMYLSAGAFKLAAVLLVVGGIVFAVALVID